MTLSRPVALAALCLALLAVYWVTIDGFVTLWLGMRGFYSHGFLVLGMVATVLWDSRSRLLQQGDSASPWFYLLLAGAVFAWLTGWLISVQTFELLAVYAVWLLAICLLLPAAAVGLFVAAFIGFAVV